MRPRFSYVAVMEFEDGSKESEVIRFPQKAWWGLFLLALISRRAARRGPLRLKDGTRAWHRPDGALEFREPWRE